MHDHIDRSSQRLARFNDRRVAFATLAVGVAMVTAPRTIHGAVQANSAPAPGTLHLHAERFELEDGTYATAERGILYVPQDRSRPDAGTLGLVFHRFPADDTVSREAPPIFRLHGGPGFGGLELDDPGYYEENVEPYTTFADVVVVGQRGFAPSAPDTECEGVREPIFDPAVPGADRARALRAASRKCRAYWQEHGLALEGMNVRQAAEDVSDIAEVLGYDRITLWGVSFGSHWGMAVLRYHPDLVARALIGGTEGPNHTYDSPTGILNALRRVAEDAESAAALRPWIPEGGLVAALRETIRRAEESPLSVTVVDSATGEERKVEVSPTILRSVADGYSSVPDSLHDMAAWPADVVRLHAGRLDALARRATPDLADDWTRIPNAAFWLLDCASGITEARAHELRSDPARQVVGATAWLYFEGCPAWNVDLGDDFRTEFETDIPTLVVHGNWDLSTPYENALELMPSFRNGKLVTVERGTHGALEEAMNASEAFREDILGFLRTGGRRGVPDRVTLPPVDWVVPSELSESRLHRGLERVPRTFVSRPLPHPGPHAPSTLHEPRVPGAAAHPDLSLKSDFPLRRAVP